MKKVLVLLLSAAMLLSLCACGSPSKPQKFEDISDEDLEAAAEALEDMYEEEPVAETEPAEIIYEIGDTIVSSDGMVEFVIETFNYTDSLDKFNCVPAEEGSKSAWSPDEGKTCLYFSGTLNYVGNAKETVSYWCDTELHYGDGYIFDADSGNGTGSIRLTGGDAGSTANGCRFEVFTQNTKVEIAGYVVVPEIVETDVESSLLLRFMLRLGGNGRIVDDVLYRIR